MKYSYPDSLITLTAAIAQACSQKAGKQDIQAAHKTKKSSPRKFKSSYPGSENRVGIKFDNILARKYFVLIHASQQCIVQNKTLEKSD